MVRAPTAAPWGLSNEQSYAGSLDRDEWWLKDLALELGVKAKKLRQWLSQGWLYGRQTPSRGLWVVWANRVELLRLRRLVSRSRPGFHGYSKDQITPNKGTD